MRRARYELAREGSKRRPAFVHATPARVDEQQIISERHALVTGVERDHLVPVQPFHRLRFHRHAAAHDETSFTGPGGRDKPNWAAHNQRASRIAPAGPRPLPRRAPR
jgi:hypothetical protein